MDNSPSTPAETVYYSWEAPVRVLSDPSAWRGVAASLGGGALALGMLFAFISRSLKGLYLAAGIFAGLMLVFVVVGAVIDMFGGFRIAFTLTGRGVLSRSGKGARSAAKAAIIGGIVTGNLTGMAAGALARSEHDVSILYHEVARVKVDHRRRYILVKGRWPQKPIGLYCNEENFTGVLKFLQERCSAAEFLGISRSS